MGNGGGGGGGNIGMIVEMDVGCSSRKWWWNGGESKE